MTVSMTMLTATVKSFKISKIDSLKREMTNEVTSNILRMFLEVTEDNLMVSTVRHKGLHPAVLFFITCSGKVQPNLQGS